MDHVTFDGVLSGYGSPRLRRSRQSNFAAHKALRVPAAVAVFKVRGIADFRNGNIIEQDAFAVDGRVRDVFKAQGYLLPGILREINAFLNVAVGHTGVPAAVGITGRVIRGAVVRFENIPGLPSVLATTIYVIESCSYHNSAVLQGQRTVDGGKSNVWLRSCRTHRLVSTTGVTPELASSGITPTSLRRWKVRVISCWQPKLM